MSATVSEIRPAAVLPASVSIPVEVFKRIVAARHTASDDATRYNIQGVCLESNGSVLRLITTNGHALSIQTLDGVCEDFAALVHQAGNPCVDPGLHSLHLAPECLDKIPMLLKLMGKFGAVFTVTAGPQGSVLLSAFGVTLTLAVVDYPDYRQVLPNFKRPVTVRLNAELLLNLAKSLGGKDRDKVTPHGITLTFDGDAPCWSGEAATWYTGAILANGLPGQSGCIMPMRR